MQLDPDAARRAAHAAELLGRDENQVRVVTPDVGGGFGPKAVFHPEELVVALAALLLAAAGEMDRGPPENFIAATQNATRSGTWRSPFDARGPACAAFAARSVHDHGATTPCGVDTALLMPAPT